MTFVKHPPPPGLECDRTLIGCYLIPSFAPFGKNQVVKVLPGGLLPGGEGGWSLAPWGWGGEASLPGDEGDEGHDILGFRVPTTSELKKFDDNR